MIRTILAGAMLLSASAALGEITVNSDFEGGAVRVISIDQENQHLEISPPEFPDRGWECWWYFRVEGINPESPLRVNVGPAPWATPDNATMSNDGISWFHTKPGVREGNRITYEIDNSTDTLWLAWGPPFVPTDARRLVEKISSQHDTASSFNLCDSREGRRTPALRITAPGDASGRKVIWIQARQHAWESGSSWVGKGFIEWLVSDEPSATELRSQADIYAVPIMDVDNAFLGAGGKSQKPQDHNRDWSETPHWNAVAAAQKHLLRADHEGRLAVFVDLHNPGAGDRFPYFYIPPGEVLDPPAQLNLNRFLDAAKTEIRGPLRFMGRTIESGRSYDPAWQFISKNWVARNTSGNVVAVTLETSWNTPSSTTNHYETVGQQLGLTINRYLSEPVGAE